MHQKLVGKCKQLEEKIRILEEENEFLSDRAEETLLLSLVAESINHAKDRNTLLENVLEKISILKAIPYCTCCSLSEYAVQVLSIYTVFSNDFSSEDRINLTPKIIGELDQGPVIITGGLYEAQGISISLQNTEFRPHTVAILPFETRSIPKGIFVFIDDDRTVDRLSPVLMLLQHIVDITSAKLDNTSLLTELRQTNAELDQRVEERTLKLKKINSELKRQITEREQAEKERMLMAIAVEYASEAVTITDRDGNIQYANPAFEQITGYTREELIGQNPRILQSGRHDKSFYKGMWNTLTNGRVWTGHFFNKKKDGTLFEEEASISPVKESAGVITNYVAVKRDVTDEIKKEKQFRQAQKMEAMGTLAGGIAHDFNNILSAVIGYSEMALEKVSQEDLLTRNIHKVLTAGYRARDLVKQILAFSRQTEQQLRPVQVKLMVKEALKLLRASLPTTIEISQNIASDSAVLADPTQVHQVLMNLCTNAGHAMREKGGILAISLTDVVLDADFIAVHSDLEPGPYLKLTVSDTGRGMSADVRERVFDPFFTTKPQGEGTGMGLAVVHGIVKSHEGAITVHSEPGGGSTFHIYFPVIEDEVMPQTKTEKSLPTGNERILFVDDEKQLMDLGKQILELLGYKVVARTSSLEALKLFQTKPDDFDLVLTDMTMPNMTGKDLAREIMRIRPNIPIILCSGFSEMITEKSAKAIGIRDFLLKPVAMGDFARTIRQALDDKCRIPAAAAGDG